jgi:hypothetical protein
MEKVIIKIQLSNGEYADPRYLYQYSNRVLMDSYNKAVADGCDNDAKALLKQILSRFEYDSCTESGESNDELFARQFSNFVNGKMRSPKDVAKKMSHDHRYLQSEMFKVCMEYIKILANNAENGYYDPRNEYACKTSEKMIDYLKEIDYPY